MMHHGGLVCSAFTANYRCMHHTRFTLGTKMIVDFYNNIPFGNTPDQPCSNRN